MKTNKLVVLAIVLALVSAVTAMPVAAATQPPPVTVQILAVNDFHGALDPSLTKPNLLDNTTW